MHSNTFGMSAFKCIHVACMDVASRTLTLQYLSDGLGPDTDFEAFHIADRVPAHHALPMHPTIQSVLADEDCNWTRRSLHLVQRIREMGVDAYLRENWERSRRR